MQTPVSDAASMLREIERARLATAQQGADNGVVLIVWGLTFLLDMVAFDLSRLTGSPLAAVIFVIGFNGAMLGWRWWYARRQPIRLRHAITYRVIFLWSWFYVALIGLGVGGWAIFIGRFPPLWFTLLGVVGALPLLLKGLQMWRHAHTDGSLAVSRWSDLGEHDDGAAITR